MSGRQELVQWASEADVDRLVAALNRSAQSGGGSKRHYEKEAFPQRDGSVRYKIWRVYD